MAQSNFEKLQTLLAQADAVKYKVRCNRALALAPHVKALASRIAGLERSANAKVEGGAKLFPAAEAKALRASAATLRKRLEATLAKVEETIGPLTDDILQTMLSEDATLADETDKN